MDIFNIKLEFNHEVFRQEIENCVKDKGKGYVCVVDANVLTMVHTNLEYREIVKDSYINTCDGGSIASMANILYGTNYKAYSGPELFSDYIGRSDIKQLLLGNTQEKYNQIISKLEENGLDTTHLTYMPLPFASIDEFDYKNIAQSINAINPDFIWISLGAPKQENFMYRILPYLNQGLMFGIGAAFNFYVGDIVQPKFHIGSFRFVWLDRLFREPKKQYKRTIETLSNYYFIYNEERKKIRNRSKSL